MPKPRPRRRTYPQMLRMLRRQSIRLQQQMDQLEQDHRHLLRQLGVLEQRVATLEYIVLELSPDRSAAASPHAPNDLLSLTGGDDALFLAQTILAIHDIALARALAWSYLIARGTPDMVDHLASSDFLCPPTA